MRSETKGIELGDEVRDNISDFKGVCVAITDWLNGCRRLTIQPRELKDGKPVEAHTFDVEQIELVKAAKVAPQPRHGGPSIAPVRSADPR